MWSTDIRHHRIALRRLRDDPGLRARLAANGPAAARDFDPTALARAMLAVLEGLAPGRRGG